MVCKDWTHTFERVCRICKEAVEWEDYSSGCDCCMRCKQEFNLGNPENLEVMEYVLLLRATIRSDFYAEA